MLEGSALSLNELPEVSSQLADPWTEIKIKPYGSTNTLAGSRKKDFAKFHRTASAPYTLENDGRESSAVGNAPRRQELKVITWNIAAPNKNPFEFWVTHNNTEYNEMMLTIQRYIDNPKPFELKICNIFTNEMYQELRNELLSNGVHDLQKLDEIWLRDLMDRYLVSEFLKDRSFGEKRLISMPDRITNSIATKGGLIYRPSPITGTDIEMNDIKTWWSLWTTYMFKTALNVEGNAVKSVFSLLETIPRAKYHAVTEDEEAISVALQTLCLAIFDAIFVHILSSLVPQTWQPLKNSLHKALFERKAALCVSILQQQYRDADVIFIQEASEAFAARAGVCLDHFVLRPSGVDARRSQLSLILVRKSLFFRHAARDVTEDVLLRLPSRCTTAGDLCVFEIGSHEGPYLLASFHGDSDGACTAPVLLALDDLARECYPDHTLLFGLDANTVAGPGFGDSDQCKESACKRAASDAQLGVALDGDGFSYLLGQRGLGSCWQGQDLRGLWTTFNARTYLQPQLHKAVGLEGVLDRRHMRLRDWLVFRAGQLAVAAVERDNTGRRGRFESRVMPSQAFPSDHAIVAATLGRVSPPSPTSARRGSTSALF